ncbi:hypothetical protein GW17_00027360 [Ensete ventricosum]|nr:hypothetical protein GW17_00027360 [Ensete ventricosum]
MARGRPTGGVAARAARDSGNRPSTTEIDRPWPILVLPPDSGRSAYRSAAEPICTGRYGSYRSVRKTLILTSFHNLIIKVFTISTCTARYGRYIPIRQVTDTRTARYFDFGHR